MSAIRNKIALITGAGRATGRAIAYILARRGAVVAANDISPDNLRETVGQITETGGQARGYLADVANKIAVQTMLHQVLDDWKHIDILVNSANVKPDDPLLDTDEWDWRRVFDVNLNSVFFTMQSVGRVMKAAGGGRIINIIPGNFTSSAGTAYHASMLGLIGLTQGAGREFAAENIPVNAICLATNEDENPFTRDHPGVPTDLAELIVFLCSPEAAQISSGIFQADSEEFAF
jgi:NAD(P)-dependent dehydrogenase (short-subunit alcohol dehydrogenase family)